MSLENVMGSTAPASGEVVNPGAAQPNAATTEAATGAVEGGTPSQERKTFTQEELDDILQKRIAKAEARAERRVMRTLERFMPGQAPAQPQQTTQQAQDGKPQRAQYANDEAYVDALTDWKLEQREAKATEGRQQEQQKSLQKKTEAIYAEAQKLPDFDRDAFDELPLTKPMVEALIDSEAAAKLMHYMASHPEEVERIATLSPSRQAAELGKLEVKATEVKPPQRSNAPAALSAVKGTPSSNSAPDPAKDPQGWIAWRNKNAARR